VWGFGALLAFGNDAKRLLPSHTNYLRTEELFNTYLDSRLKRLSRPKQDVIRRATAYRAEDRYDSCTEVLVDFDRAIHNPEGTIIYQSASPGRKHLPWSKALSALIKSVVGV
jgi:hypothetical protein